MKGIILFKKSFNSGFNFFVLQVFLLCVGGDVGCGAVSNRLERGASSWELFWVVPHCLCLPFGFYLFEEKRSKCSLISAGGQPGSIDVGGVAMWRLKKQTCSVSFLFLIKMYERVFNLDLTLMSPQGTAQRRSLQVDGRHVGLKTEEGTFGKERHESQEQTKEQNMLQYEEKKEDQ